MTPVNLGTDERLANSYFAARPLSAGKQPRSLAQAVELAAGLVDDRALRPVIQANARLEFQTRTILALLTFCYARQVYSSKVIVAQMRRDFDPIGINDRDLPNAGTLQRFRGENRGPLCFCLKAALQFLAEEKVKQGFVTHVKESHIAHEASRRIVMAMFTDSLEVDQTQKPDFELNLPWLPAQIVDNPDRRR
jgi:hypothetical protein